MDRALWWAPPTKRPAWAHRLWLPRGRNALLTWNALLLSGRSTEPSAQRLGRLAPTTAAPCTGSPLRPGRPRALAPRHRLQRATPSCRWIPAGRGFFTQSVAGNEQLLARSSWLELGPIRPGTMTPTTGRTGPSSLPQQGGEQLRLAGPARSPYAGSSGGLATPRQFRCTQGFWT